MALVQTIQRGDADSITHHIVTSIAALVNTPPSDLPPLTDVIDPDALNRLLTPRSNAITVLFRYTECTIKI